jgi:hypothetical protein
LDKETKALGYLHTTDFKMLERGQKRWIAEMWATNCYVWNLWRGLRIVAKECRIFLRKVGIFLIWAGERDMMQEYTEFIDTTTYEEHIEQANLWEAEIRTVDFKPWILDKSYGAFNHRLVYRKYLFLPTTRIIRVLRRYK